MTSAPPARSKWQGCSDEQRPLPLGLFFLFRNQFNLCRYGRGLEQSTNGEACRCSLSLAEHPEQGQKGQQKVGDKEGGHWLASFNLMRALLSLSSRHARCA